MPKMQVILFAAALLCARASAVAVVPSSSSTQPIQPTTSSSQTTSTQPSVTPTPEMMPEMPTMDMSFGADPHFSVALPTGDMLCYTIQGEKNMIFNLITSNKLVMNALFIGDKRREEVTWIGEIGIIIPNGISQNVSSLVFNAKTKKINIERKTELFAGSISKITIDGGKISVATGYIVLKEPKVEVVLRDIDVTLSVKFFDGHLDLFWHSTGVGNEDSHGLIGESILCCTTYIAFSFTKEPPWVFVCLLLTNMHLWFTHVYHACTCTNSCIYTCICC